MSASSVDDLFALPPSEFTAARNGLARTLKGDDRKAVAALRRPSPAAWALNQFARRSPDELARLAALGAQLAAAQAGLAADALRALGAQRRQLVVSMAAQVRSLAGSLGHPLPEAAAREVEQTLEAVLADPEAAAAVQAGRLVHCLEHTGFGVDLDSAVGLPAARAGASAGQQTSGQAGQAEARRAEARQEQTRKEQVRREHARRAMAAAAAAAAAATEADRLAGDADVAAARAAQADERADAAGSEVRALEARLVEARRHHDQLAAAARDARSDAAAAADAAAGARAGADAAALEAERLERGSAEAP